MKKRKIKCPVCNRETNWENNPYRPFCSEKCKFADLHKWLNEEYFIEETTSITGVSDNEKESS